MTVSLEMSDSFKMADNISREHYSVGEVRLRALLICNESWNVPDPTDGEEYESNDYSNAEQVVSIIIMGP